MNFLANILWIAMGVALLGLARSYRGAGHGGTARIAAILGVLALAIGILK